ncbi:MAG: OmpH family outer membrane protein [Fimbriimonadaceae bacterium]|nr:OmpH family outer membrane protein [Chthonomonadaceae bacterium]MCO5296348.1 OmpH family outer membrane protein [Fimbriimonadaceae bacterium]
MQKLTVNQSGWLAAALIAGAAIGVGFQGSAEKSAVVDVQKVVEQSDYGKQNQVTFNEMKAGREGLLEFIDTYRVLTTEQAQKIRDLSLKVGATAPEKAELERVKADVIAADKKSKELSQKPNLTPEERTLIEEYARRSQAMEATAQRWFREFTNELQTWADQQKLTSVEKARAAIQEVGKAGGYSIVFEAGVAPYGANDLTDAALKAMNAKK